MNTDLILSRKISFFDSLRNKNPQKELSIFDALGCIKEQIYFDKIAYLRTIREKSEDEYNSKKRELLPAFTFSGTFFERKAHTLKKYNQIMSIDIDDLSISELERIRNVALKDDYIFAFWKSPSNCGIKALICLESKVIIDNNYFTIRLFHQKAFSLLKDYFKNRHNVEIDKKCGDISRLCFVSCDESLICKNEAKTFKIDDFNISDIKTISKRVKRIMSCVKIDRNTLYNPQDRNNPTYRKILQSIIRFLTKTNKSITNHYNDWNTIAFVIATCFTYDIGEKYFIALSKLDKEKYNEEECKEHLKAMYASRMYPSPFSSLIKMAEEEGYKNLGK